MSETTAKPYLVRALHQWCEDNAYTPYVVVQVSEKTKVPMAYVRDGQITLNVSVTAVHRLTLDNDWMLFNARFNGVSQEVAVPMSAIVGIYARETGYGMGFEIQAPDATVNLSDDSVTTAPSAAQELVAQGESVSVNSDISEEQKTNRSRGHLSVVK